MNRIDLSISPSSGRRRLIGFSKYRRLDDSNSEDTRCDLLMQETGETVLQRELDSVFVVSKIEIRHQNGCCFNDDINVKLSIFNMDDETFQYDGILSPFQDEKYEIFIGNKLGDKVIVEVDSSSTVLKNANVEVFGSTASILSFDTAVQSSDYWDGGEAKLAIDGDTNGDWSLGSVSSTAGGYLYDMDTNPWWIGTLKHISAISNIKIYNRNDCCLERIIGFRLTISVGDEDVFMYNDKSTIGQSVYEIPMDATIGNKIKIELPPGLDRILHLAEVEVYGFELPSSPFQSAAQISTHDGAEANFAMDKNEDGVYGTEVKSYSQTVLGMNPWWEGTLNQVSTISMITIYNMDTKQDRLEGFHLTLLNDDIVTFMYIDGAKGIQDRYDIFVPFRVGNKVRIELKGMKRILSLAEVEVFGSGGFVPTFRTKMVCEFFFSSEFDIIHVKLTIIAPNCRSFPIGFMLEMISTVNSQEMDLVVLLFQMMAERWQL